MISSVVSSKLSPIVGVCLLLPQAWSEIGAAHPKTIPGRIVARRTGEAFEMVSFVINQSNFLFEPRDKPSDLIKLSYPHEGYSTLPAKWFGSDANIEIRAKRDKRCDESLASFLGSSPEIPLMDMGSGKKDKGLPGIIWIGSHPTVPPTYKLACYSLIVSKDNSRQ